MWDECNYRTADNRGLCIRSPHGGGHDPTVVGYHPAFEGDGCSLAPPSERVPPTGYDNNNHHLTRLASKIGIG